MNTEKQKQSQTEEVITKLPLVLDKDILIELTNKPTLHRIQEFVLSCYVERNSEQAESFQECFEEIECNKLVQASLASASAKAKSLFRGKE